MLCAIGHVTVSIKARTIEMTFMDEWMNEGWKGEGDTSRAC